MFLARLTETKGIFIALEAFSQLQRKYPYLKMRIVGDGPARIEAESFVADRKMENVVFTGGLAGKELISEYEDADLYLLPTYHEGMPTSVLEAMAFGLPVITRPVGGLKDFFVNGRMGEMVDSLRAQDFVFAIEKYLNDEHLSHEVAVFNYDFAKSHFLASMALFSLAISSFAGGNIEFLENQPAFISRQYNMSPRADFTGSRLLG